MARVCRSIVGIVTSSVLLSDVGARAATTNTPAALVPLAAMTASNRALARPVVERHTLRRQYRPRLFRGRTEHFEFLLDHIAACSILAESLGLIVYRAVEEEPGRTFADDRIGAQGYIQQVYRSDGQRIFYVEGTQRGVFDVGGRGVAVVRYKQCAPDMIEYTGSMFVKVDNRIVAAFAELLYVFVKGTVDRHFDGRMWQPIRLSGMALDEPATLRRRMAGMPAEDYAPLAPLAALLPCGTNAVAR